MNIPITAIYWKERKLKKKETGKLPILNDCKQKQSSEVYAENAQGD